MSTYPDRDRRGSDRPDSGRRRRSDDDAIERLLAWMEAHDDWARSWSSAMDERMKAVERRADLLDGRAGNDQGLIGTIGKLTGAVEGMEKRQERQAAALEAVRGDVRDVKMKTGAEDGQKKLTRAERYIALMIPVLVAVLPVVGTIIAAYFALRGQLAQAPGR